jgi:hypothetical protein
MQISNMEVTNHIFSVTRVGRLAEYNVDVTLIVNK